MVTVCVLLGKGWCRALFRQHLRGHGGTRVYRRRAVAEIGRLQYWAGMIWVLYTVDARLRIDAICV